MACLSNAYYGVDLFFLLSGFLIMRILQRAHHDNGSFYRNYLKKRCLRIYPAFLFALALGVAVRVWYVKDTPFRTYDFLCNLVFLNGCPGFMGRIEAYAEASWTLFLEACFYLSMPCLLLAADRAGGRGPLARLLRPALVLSVALLVYGQMPRFVMFFFGVMVGSFGDNVLKRLAEQLSTRWVLAAYLAACAAFSFGALRTEYFIPIFGPAASILFIKSCWGRGFLNGLFSLSALRGFGNISYSFYLTHISCVILVTDWLRQPLRSLPLVPAYAIFLAACMALSLSVAVVSFAVCERWYFRKTKPSRAKGEVQEPPTILPFAAGKAA